jgi:magnesium transporter
MLTASAMAYYETDLASALVLALFIPLIISSGGNSGAQASTLIIRAMATLDVRLRDWWRVFRREVALGFCLGAVLAGIGFLRIALWPNRTALYTEHYLLVAFVVGLSLVGVVAFGSLVGAMLPFALRKLKLDPATCSAPFVATLVDVTGLIIYFSVAQVVLRGTLLVAKT